MKLLLQALLPATLLLAGGCNSTDFQIGARNRTSAQLQTYDSCGDLQSALQSSLSEQMRVQLLNSGGGWGMPMAGGMEDASTTSDSSQSGRTAGEDFSTTNNQEAGVDEADFVKVAPDGMHIYMLNGDRLEIVGVPDFGDIDHQGTLRIEGSPTTMLASQDQVVVFSSIYAWALEDDHPLRAYVGTEDDQFGWWYWSSNFTKLTVVDVSDASAPAVTRELYLEGWYQTAREVDDTVRMINYSTMEIPGLQQWVELEDYTLYDGIDWSNPMGDVNWSAAVMSAINHNNDVIAATSLDDLVPSIYERSGDSFIVHPFTTSDCQSFSSAQDSLSRGITSILTLDLNNSSLAFDQDHIVSNWSTIYASQDTLIVAEMDHDWWWFWSVEQDFEPATNLHRFDISQAGNTTYTGSGRIDGTIGGQFALSEYEGVIRVASTTGGWWWGDNAPDFDNHVFTLAGTDQLDILGHLSGIAQGETIWSSRFVGDKAYLVTFLQIDPLWTVDLKNPAAPMLRGELEVPGVSTYIHPIDDHLLTIGYAGDENGLDWTTQISLFDVSDFDAPALDANLGLAPPTVPGGWSYAWSEALYEHKAFQYWAPRELLAVPLSTYRWVETFVTEPNGERYYDYEYEFYSTLQLVQVSENGLELAGQIDHSHFFNSESDYFWGFRDIRRSVFMGDYIYAISDRGVTATNLDTFVESASLELEGTDYNYGYYGAW